MSLLVAVTLASVTLAAVALLGGLATIVAHAVRRRREHRRKLTAEKLVRDILANIEKPDWDAELVRAMARDPGVGAEIFAEMTELIRGRDAGRLLDLSRRAGIQEWLLRRTRSLQPERRRSALELLRLFPGAESRKALHRALGDTSSEVRLAAALSLAELGAAPSVSKLVAALLRNTREHPLLLSRLFDRLAALRPEEVLAVAENAAMHPFLRSVAVRSLGKAGRAECKSATAALIDDPEPGVRAAALDAIADLGDLDAAEHIRRALSDPEQFVRIRAISAARRLELVALLPVIAGLRHDANWWVRFRAEEAVAALGTPTPAPAVPLPIVATGATAATAGTAERSPAERGAA